MSAAMLCSAGAAKSYSLSQPPCDKKMVKRMLLLSADTRQQTQSTVAAALAEQELRMLGIRLPTIESGKSPSHSNKAISLSAPSVPAPVSSLSTPTSLAPSATACFGRSLDNQPRREVPGFGRIPALLIDCCEYLRASGHLSVEGLFRIEGSRLRLRDLRQRLERGCGIREGTPPQDVCSTLKAWLRELPEPLVPARMAFALAEAAGQASVEHRIRVLRLCGLLLSPDQLASLHFLCEFLGEVSRASHLNRMDASNLATSLGPSLLPIGDSRLGAKAAVTCPRELARLNSGVALLIEHPGELGRWPAGLHRLQHRPPPSDVERQHPHHLHHYHQLHQLHQLHQRREGGDESVITDDSQQRQRRRRSSGAIGGALKAVGRAVSRLASRSRSRSPGRAGQQQQQRPPRASPSPPAVRRLLHRLSGGSSSSGGGAVRRGVAAVAPAADHLPPLAPLRSHKPLPPPPLPPLSTLPSISALRTPLLMHHQQQQQQFHRAASASSPSYCSSSSAGPLRAVHSIPTTPLRVLHSPLA